MSSGLTLTRELFYLVRGRSSQIGVARKSSCELCAAAVQPLENVRWGAFATFVSFPRSAFSENFLRNTTCIFYAYMFYL